MKIYIELVVIFVLMFIFIAWRVWFDRSKKKILKKYNPEDNISKKTQDGKNYKGGVFNGTEEVRATEQRVGTAEHRIEPAPSSSIGHEQPEGRELLQETAANDDGENGSVPGEISSSTRENTSSVRRRFFGKRKQK